MLRLIGGAARSAGLEWLLVREGAGHEVWELDGIRVMVPRHREINERTALAILRVLEDRLGDRWWRQ